MTDAPKSHPRYLSLIVRDKIVDGIRKGITSEHGLIAHGRGEALDYILGEKTHDFAKKAIETAAAMLLLAKKPIISVNGNAAALVPKELIKLGKLVNAKLEVNIFHTSKKREIKIQRHLLRNGAKQVLLPKKKLIPGIAHNRSRCNPEGIYKADVVFVPLEDGDRCQALRKMDKDVITVDLNPMSRTSKTASITIVDNIIRAMPLLIDKTYELRKEKKDQLEKVIKNYDNKKVLADALRAVKR
ncbi:phosphopantothenate/pantothenate synthetase [Candidatus Woesearchaeota archaeon]|nr:phosphopantothenate/pantothenate synthetase [Candidatus Woesearchaeota archaeon]